MARSKLQRPVPVQLASSFEMQMPMRWQPCGGSASSPVITVVQGDLTACALDAIVNPANCHLAHGGGVAGAIVNSGGQVINDESRAWIKKHKTLPVGQAMSTSAGALPCRFVIHTVGPMVGGGGSKLPTPEQAQQLRNAVWSALCEAEALKIASVVIPGISSGIFGYPRDLAAREILGECVRFIRERKHTTTLKAIVLMNIDKPTCGSFIRAVREVMELSAQENTPEGEVATPHETAKGFRQTSVRSNQELFDIMYVRLTLPLVWGIQADRTLSARAIRRNALSRLIGELGATSIDLLKEQKPDEKVTVLAVLRGVHTRHVPFYMRS